MYPASKAYKDEMRKQLRDHSFIRVSIGVINQEAQAGAFVPEEEQYTYYSDLRKPLEAYDTAELYASCEEDYSSVDGSMYFMPRTRDRVALNEGIVSKTIKGVVTIRFDAAYDIRGLTIAFGKTYPISMRIESDHDALSVSDNHGGHFVTEKIFRSARFLRIIPLMMSNGQGRLHVHRITMGAGIYFDNTKIKSMTKRECISPVSKELPTLDLNLTVDNKNRAFDVENDKSTVHFLQLGQTISLLYGQETDEGRVEWIPGAAAQLKTWSADDNELKLTATDRFDQMNGTYRRGTYREEGISLYDLAVDVMQSAGVDARTYSLDPYLKKVKVKNPLPAVSCKEALQIIANAGRCILYQDRSGKIAIKSSFMPGMSAKSEDEAAFSEVSGILTPSEKRHYALSGQDFTDAGSARLFLPRGGRQNVGYVSEAVADASGKFTSNPTIEIRLESAFSCFGLELAFDRNPPEEMTVHTYLNDEKVEDYALQTAQRIEHEFTSFDRMVLEFTKGAPNNRVALQQLRFGSRTDYRLDYSTELTKTPLGTQLEKVKELQVVRTVYGPGAERKVLAKERLQGRHTFLLHNPCYDFSCGAAGAAVRIIESGSYFVTVESDNAAEVSLLGREYAVSEANLAKQLSETGQTKKWKNPLVSEQSHAEDLAEWIGSYLKADREYTISYRGEPRIDANDLLYLENKYTPELMLRITDHTLSFDGALSGTIKARREAEDVEKP